MEQFGGKQNELAAKLRHWKMIRSQRAERKALIKCKSCVVCDHFCWFHGSAGVCDAKTGCAIGRMRDVSDVCDCGGFTPILVRD